MSVVERAIKKLRDASPQPSNEPAVPVTGKAEDVVIGSLVSSATHPLPDFVHQLPTVKKSGKVMATGRIVVSADGKSRIVTLNGTTAKGKKFSNTAVYDKG